MTYTSSALQYSRCSCRGGVSAAFPIPPGGSRVRQGVTPAVQCALQVLRRLELPGTICACGAALTAGDLGAPPGGPAATSPAAALLPMFAAGDRSGGHRAWLADVLAALLLSAQAGFKFRVNLDTGLCGLCGVQLRGWS